MLKVEEDGNINKIDIFKKPKLSAKFIGNLSSVKGN